MVVSTTTVGRTPNVEWMKACTSEFTQLDTQQPRRARANHHCQTSTDMMSTSTDRNSKPRMQNNSHRLEAALSQERTPIMRYHPGRKPTSRPKLQNNANSQFIRTDLAKPAEVMVKQRARAKVIGHTRSLRIICEECERCVR